MAGMLKTGTQPTESELHGAVAVHLTTTARASPQQIASPMRGAGGAADAALLSNSASVSILTATLTGLAKNVVQPMVCNRVLTQRTICLSVYVADIDRKPMQLHRQRCCTAIKLCQCVDTYCHFDRACEKCCPANQQGGF